MTDNNTVTPRSTHFLTLSVIALCAFMSGCITLNNPVSAVLGTGGGTGTSGGGGSSCGTALTVTVDPLYPANGVEWMDHVQTAATTLACDGTTVTGGFETCIHGGERRRVDLVGTADCTGVTATDALGAFDWSCDDNGVGDAYVFSVSLKKGKGLKEILNAAGTAFEPNSVSVSSGGCTIASSVATAWWGNTITVLTDNATDQTAVTFNGANSGTIYTVPADTTVDGVFITGNKIAVVTLGTAALRFSGMGFDSDSNGQLQNNGNCAFNGLASVVSDSSCLISVSGADFVWLEGRFRGDHDTNYVATYNPSIPTDPTRLIYFTQQSTYNTLRNLTINGGASSQHLLNAGGGGTPSFANSRGYNIKLFGTVNPVAFYSGVGSTLTQADYNIFEKLIIGNATGQGFIAFDTLGNRFINVKVYGALDHGFSITGNSGGPTYTEESTFVNVLSAGNASANGTYNFNINMTRRNTISHLTHGNYDNGTLFTGSMSISSAGGANPEKNTLVNQLAVNINRSVILPDNTTDTLFHTIAASHFGSGGNDRIIRISGTSVGLTLGGRVWQGNILNGAFGCTVAGNITANTCQYGGTTDPILTNLDLLADVVGQTTDTTNLFGATGNVTYANLLTDVTSGLLNWIAFDSFHKFFGHYGGTAGLAAEDHRPCRAAGTDCQIYSLGLGGAATLKNINGTLTPGAACPASVDASVAANVLTDQLTAPNTFLINAREVIDDYNSAGTRIGDDDGLCESNEACIFSPDIGATDLLEADIAAGPCTPFSGGNGVVGVNIYQGIAE